MPGVAGVTDVAGVVEEPELVWPDPDAADEVCCEPEAAACCAIG